jgi:hypothetical protein
MENRDDNRSNDVYPPRTAFGPDEGISAKSSWKLNGSQINGNQVQCRIFSTTFNPEGLRLGNKVLRQRLKGPALASYYPRKMGTIQDLQRLYAEHLEIMDEGEEDRLEKIKM